MCAQSPPRQDYVMDVVGALEHDPDFKTQQKHREFLQVGWGERSGERGERMRGEGKGESWRGRGSSGREVTERERMGVRGRRWMVG